MFTGLLVAQVGGEARVSNPQRHLGSKLVPLKIALQKAAPLSASAATKKSGWAGVALLHPQDKRRW